jgi:hypothetical protein
MKYTLAVELLAVTFSLPDHICQKALVGGIADSAIGVHVIIIIPMTRTKPRMILSISNLKSLSTSFLNALCSDIPFFLLCF